jgi:hypothetical protein
LKNVEGVVFMKKIKVIVIVFLVINITLFGFIILSSKQRINSSDNQSSVEVSNDNEESADNNIAYEYMKGFYNKLSNGK